MLNSNHLATIATLARKVGPEKLGRTRLMKLLYFLQELNGVSLEYKFTIQSYSPFDSAVLSDLGDTERLGLVKTYLKLHSQGYGYEIGAGPEIDLVSTESQDFVKQNEELINSIVQQFGSESPSDLELQSTIHFAFTEASSKSDLSREKLAETVKGIKPKFSLEYIQTAIAKLEKIGAISI